MNKWLRRGIYFITSILTLLVFAFVVLQTRWAKNIVRNKLQAYISQKTNTEFKVNSVDYSLFTSVELDGVFMRDLANDTLLYGKKIKADLSMIKLLGGKYQVDKILLEDIYINLHKKVNDSVFNYQFVIDAFKNKSEKRNNTDTSIIDFSLNEITLTNIRFNMLDEGSGSFTKMSVTDFTLKLKSLDLNKMDFDIDKLYANEFKFQLVLKKISPNSTTKSFQASYLPFIKADSLIVKNSFISYHDEVNKISSSNTIGLLKFGGLTNKDNPTVFKGKFVQLTDADIVFTHAPNVTAKNNTTTESKNYGFVIEKIDFNNNQITYNNTAAPVKINGFDYAHLAIKDLRLRAVNNTYNKGTVQTTIKAFSFKDKSGFAIDSLSGLVKLDSHSIIAKDFYVKTAGSTINASVAIYPTPLMNTAGNTKGFPENNLILTNTIISKKDLDLLADGLTAKFKKQLNVLGDLLINANIRGNAKQLMINDLSVRSKNGQALALDVSGTAANVTDAKNISYNLNIKNLTASKALMDPFVNSTKQPMNLPPTLSLNGLLAGNMNRLQTNLQMVSAFGKAVVKGTLINFKDLNRMQYDMVLNAANLETGKWIFKDSLFGKLTGTITAKGFNGFDVKTITLKTTAKVSSFRVERNNYKNIKLNLVLVKGLADFIASVNDELLQVNMNGNANVQTDYPAVDAFVNLQKADLYALGFSKDSLIVKTLSKIDVKNSTPENLDVMVRLDSSLLKAGSQQIYADSAIMVASIRNDSTIISLNSSLADAGIVSNLTYLQMSDLLKEVLAKYISNQNNLPITKVDPGTIAASIFIKPSEQYTAFIKSFSFNNIVANVALSNKDKDSAIKGNIIAKEITVGTNKVSNLAANIHGTSDSLQLVVNIDTVRAGNILLYDAMVKAGLSNQTISISVNTKDAKKTEQFAVAVVAIQNQTTGEYNIQLKDALTLNYKKWQVSEKNRIRIDTGAFNVSNFNISNNQQKISIESISPALNAPLKVAMDAFKISTITAVFNKDSMLMEGLLNANFTASNFDQPIPTFDGTLRLDSLFYQQMAVGNLSLKASGDNGAVNVIGKLEGNGNNVDMSGNYDANNIDIKINLNPLMLATVQPFTKGNLTRSSGAISGPINITGAAEKPEWNGVLTFNGVQTTAAKFGTILKMDGQKLTLQYPTVSFDNFTILDSTGNPLKINGTLTQNDQKDFVSDLSVTAHNFNVINNTGTDNNMLYGKGIVELDAAIKGTVTAPDLSGNILVKNGTAITYVKQNTLSSFKERDELVEFVDMDTIRNLVTKNTLQEVMKQKANGIGSGANLQYNLNLEVEPEAKFTVIVDPATNDELQVQGKAQINMGVNPNGDLALTGIYDLKGGSYQLNYGPVKRKFTLLEGSNIKLSGDPENADADITATYEISTSPIDLIGNEIGGLSTAENALYKRKVPFQVLLKIKGPISKPVLNFDIVVKEKAAGVSYELQNTIENKLQQLRADPSAINKQVFALLALNRFIADESRDYFAGNGVANTNLLANKSVSGFLNAAVNQIAADLIKGVDIDINLKNVDDDPAAIRTDLNVMLGKSFLNDRLNVSFGKNFTVDGNDPSVKGRNSSNRNVQFIPDVNSAYKLSSDGRYMLRGYRRTQYEAIMDGYFIETGFAFSFTMDYDQLKELLAKKKK